MGTATSRALTLTAGTLDLHGKTLTLFGTVTIGSGSGTRAIVDTSGNGTINITQTTATTVWSYSGTNFTTSNTWTIKISGTVAGTQTFAGGGATYSNLWYTNGSASQQLTVSGSNTFADFKCTDTNVQTLAFTAGTTQTVTTFTVSGTAGSQIVITSTSTATHSLVKAGGGTITCDQVSVQHSVATPSVTWLATNSTNNQATATAGSGWYFGSFPAAASGGAGFFALAAGA